MAMDEVPRARKAIEQHPELLTIIDQLMQGKIGRY